MNRKRLEERARLQALSAYEREVFKEGFQYIAGLDEVGRGPIAGPVVAAAVILPADFFLEGVDDSKKLTAPKRRELSLHIKSAALGWAVGAVFPPLLDQINIFNATREAMHLAVANLHPQPDYLLIDALSLPDIRIRQRSIIKGDSLSISIACASIIAKVERDAAMESFDLLYPGYGFARHKGYATREHLESLLARGPSPLHRCSFEPVKSLLAGGPYGEQPGLFDQD